MKNDKVLGTWLSPELIKMIKVYCANHGITIKRFIEDGSKLMFEKEGRYGKKSIK